MKEFIIDLFSGAGGTSTGIHLADGNSKVIACVNHDHNAIQSHKLNHPNCKHFVEDVRNPVVVFFLKLRVDALRKLHPGCIITIWASLECTNFSNAKGGLPRDADSRTLANSLFLYLDWLNPEYLMIENVREFMAWGPLDENGKPKSRNKGEDYMRWVNAIKNLGYRFDWRMLNSANYGAYTARERYFAQFAKEELPISWPKPTHSKNPSQNQQLFDRPLQKWKPVKEVLDLDVEGESIFTRKKPLVENTLKRIYAGLVKFVANGEDSFLKKYYSGRPAGKVISVNGPAGTIKTIDGHAYVNCDFLIKYNSTNKSGKYVPPSVNQPCPTVTTQNRLGVVKMNFLHSYYGNGQAHDIEEPSPTLTTKDRLAKVNFLMMNFSKGSNIRSIDEPGATVLTNDKHNLVHVKPGARFLFNPQYKNKGNSIEEPAPVVIARQDKKPLGLVSCTKGGEYVISIDKTDNETMVKIKLFMAHFGIIDIKMRMLMISELLRIQGFPEDYQLVGNQTEQKKYLGNAVEVNTAKAIISAHYRALTKSAEYAQ